MTDKETGSYEKDIDDILTYYENTPNEESIALEFENIPETKTEKKEEKIPETKNHISMSREEYLAWQKKSIRRVRRKAALFYTLSLFFAVCIVIGGFFLGRYVIPVPDREIDNQAEIIKESHSGYSRAKSDNATLQASINALNEDSNEISENFDNLVDYKKRYDDVSEEYEKEKDAYNKAKVQHDSLKKTYEDVSKQLDDIKDEPLTLTPGIYIAGEHIPVGEYEVTGDGSMLVANSDNDLKVNMRLDDDESECRLNDGDIIKLHTEAKFKRESKD